MSGALVLLLVALALFIILLGSVVKKEGYLPYVHLRAPFNGPDSIGGCEFQEDCLGNVGGRTIQLSNGLQGVCYSSAVACPYSGIDQYDAMKRLGML